MNVIHVESLEQREITEGYRAKLVHGESMTIAHWEIDGGYSLPTHSHPHEQVVNVTEGEFELTVDGHPHMLKAGDIFIIPGDVPHSGRSISDCRIIDIWHPTREDYR